MSWEIFTHFYRLSIGIKKPNLYACLNPGGVLPERIQVIETPGFGLEDVYHDIDVIQHEPIDVLGAGDGPEAPQSLQPFLHRVRQGADLRIGSPAAENQEIGVVHQFPHLQGLDVHALLVFQRPHDGGDQVFLLGCHFSLAGSCAPGRWPSPVPPVNRS